MRLLAETCEVVASIAGKNEKVETAAAYLRVCPLPDAELSAIYLSGRVFPARDERTLQVGGALLWRTIVEVAATNDAKLALAFRKYGDLGSAACEVLASRPKAPAAVPPLTLAEVADCFSRLAEARGPTAKHLLLRELLARATPLEAKYLVKIMTGELRIGFKESLVEEASAKAWQVPVEAVKRANMLLGDLAETVRLTAQGRAGEARMRLFHPIGFMLASPAASAEEAFAQFAEMVVEDKYDGIRAQAHCSGGTVRLFSRTLDDVTDTFPELVTSLAAFPEDVILDGEILGWDFDRNGGSARPFSELQKRLGRKRVTLAMIRQVPVVYAAFDVLYAGHELLLERPLRERAAILDALFARLRHPLDPEVVGAQEILTFDAESDLPRTSRVLRAPSARATSAAHLDELFERAQARSNEGLMIKDAASPYTPGRRGQSWLKLKRELATLDVVVTAVEFGHGKRAGVLSDYTFAVRDASTPASATTALAGGPGQRLLNVGKAYSGLTDAEIACLSEWFREHTVRDHGQAREVEPAVVLEVAFNAVMRSDRHESGFALRFPRIVRLRPDKPVSEIDTLQRVQEIYSRQIHLQRTA